MDCQYLLPKTFLGNGIEITTRYFGKQLVEAENGKKLRSG